MDRIYLSSPDVTELEQEAVLRAMRSGWIAPLGPEVDAFEAGLAAYCGRKHAVALSSGTAALHLGLLTLGVGPGDLVLTASMTFAATANAIVYTGAKPVFIDCDETGNMSPVLLAEALEAFGRQGHRPKAIVPVDLLGKVADYVAINSVAAQWGVPVLADAAESLGAVRDGSPAGSFGVAAAISFNGNKIMTTSGGGALLTDDSTIANRVRYLATQARQPTVHYEHTEVGYNYRMSNILAALGRAQLSRLDEMIERRRQLRLHYRQLVHDAPGVSVFGEPSGSDGSLDHDNFWLTSLILDPDQARISVDQLVSGLTEHHIEARPLWKPMHLQPVYKRAQAFVDGTSERLHRTGASLPSGSALREDQIGYISARVSTLLSDTDE